MTEKRGTILIVDDKQVNCDILKQMLASDYYVITAANGEEALQQMKNNELISAVILDLLMPIMDGFEFLKRTKEEGLIVPVIVITSEEDGHSEEKALELGAIDYIKKPVKPAILKKRVYNAVLHNQVALLDRMQYISTHDSLTGLYNRTKMFEETVRMIEAHKDTKFVFIRFDIDRFRLYNSAMGESEGNKLLQFIASQIRETSSFFEYATFGRVDADVFCLCEPYDDATFQKQVAYAEHLKDHYREDYVINSSFGVYIIDDISESVENMYTKASLAADKCKHMLGVNVAYYDEEMGQKIADEHLIAKEMRKALLEEQFHVFIQPKYDMKTNKPCGGEALVRWMHPTKGLISPMKFIPVFESNGFITSLDQYMWEHACMILRSWKDQGRNLVPLSVNMSRISLYNPHITEQMLELLKKYDLTPDLLNLEVTESAYMSNPELMHDTIKGLQDVGFTIMMDDFGSGYSSLNTLKNIKVDVLKIDMKFLPDKKEDVRSEKILSSIIRMSGWLGMPVIAEGVEDAAQKEFLESIGCNYVQGYYYARPMPVEEFEDLIATNSTSIAPTELFENKDADLIWSSNPQVDKMLSSITTPVVIIEYGDDTLELVRGNRAFISTFQVYTNKDFQAALSSMDNRRLKATLEEAIDLSDITECEISYKDGSGDTKWYTLRAQSIGTIEKSNIICCTYIDITSEKKFETEVLDLRNMMEQKNDKKKMLIVDDSDIARALLENLFKDRYDIINAKDGVEALTLFKENADDIAIILLDMFMPNMNGDEFLKAKNEFDPDNIVPVIVISSEDNYTLKIEMLRLGVLDYVTKPFDPEVIRQKVKNVITFTKKYSNILATVKDSEN